MFFKVRLLGLLLNVGRQICRSARVVIIKNKNKKKWTDCLTVQHRRQLPLTYFGAKVANLWHYFVGAKWRGMVV